MVLVLLKNPARVDGNRLFWKKGCKLMLPVMTLSCASPSVPIHMDAGPEPTQPGTGPQPGSFPLRRLGCRRLTWEIICANSSKEAASIATLFRELVVLSAVKSTNKALTLAVKSVVDVSY